MIRFPAVLMTALLLTSCGSRHDPLAGFPSVVLWAWDRPEHLSYIDPQKAGVAFLARTISWRDGHLSWRPRYQPLELPPGAQVIAVIRLQSDSPPLPDAHVIASQILEAANLPRIRAIQIDFDARQSERDWYAVLLRILHTRLPPNVSLTITALASWCLGDTWIKNLPIDDAVPMLFRMGKGEPAGIADFPIRICRSSVGISTDEAPFVLPRGRRIFIFHPHPWTLAAYSGAMELAKRLR